MQIAARRQLRTIFNLPPRHGKTVFIAQYFPFYWLGLFPNEDIIYCSATKTLAEEQGEFTRNLITEYGPKLFGITISKSSKAKDNWDIATLDGKPTGGSMRCFGVDSSVHGRNAHLLVCDDMVGSITDAISPAHREMVHRVYTSSLYTRLAPNGAVVSIGTPTHSDDWFGRMQRAEDEGGDKWIRIKLPALCNSDDDLLKRNHGDALWPDRWTKELLETTKKNMFANNQARDWKSQYDLEPVSGDGISEWPQAYFDGLYEPHKFTDIWQSVMSIDVSKGARAQKKGDWQAFAFCQVDTKGHIKVDCQLHRLDVAGLKRKSLELIKKWRPDAVVVETNNMGYTLFEALMEERVDGEFLRINGRNHNSLENKVNRITQRLGTALESGILHFDKTPHNQMVIDQLRFHPHSDYDDGADAIEMSMEFLGQLRLPSNQRLVKYQTRKNFQMAS